jgi:hypothetical protein
MYQSRYLVVVLSVGFGIASAAAQPQDHSAHQRTKGQSVTLMSCVEKGLKPDTFILTHTADVPVHPTTMGRVVYWLDSVKPLRSHVGHQVRIMGTVSDVKQAEMEVKLGEDAEGGWTVEIEGPGRDVRTTPERAGVPTARSNQKTDIKTTLVKLKVTDITMVADRCVVAGK